jgi:hypothetical protein
MQGLIARVRRALRVALEKAAGTYEEGPESPSRLADAVRAFAVVRHDADAGEWERFAVSEVERAYQEGWVRGFEAHLRGQAEEPPWMHPELAPVHPYMERVLSLGYDPGNPLARATEAEREEFFRVLQHGGRVVDGDEVHGNPGSHGGM